MNDSELLLLAVLNSTPVVRGVARDELTGSSGLQRLRTLGGSGAEGELERVRLVRDGIQAIVRGSDGGVGALESIFVGVTQRPIVTAEGVTWQLQTPAETELAVRVVMAWSEVMHRLHGRLRPCGNEECRLFLIDYSRPGTAKWCSMATCGNRMKARAHVQRSRS